MNIRHLKRGAKLLKRACHARDPLSLERVGFRLGRYMDPDDITHSDCLETVAREAGYADYQQAKKALEEDLGSPIACREHFYRRYTS